MKKFFIIAAMLLTLSTASAQSYTRQGNNFTQVEKKSSTVKTATKHTFTAGGKTYPIYLSKNGRAYIMRISKSGNEYKQYLGEEISRQVCKEMGVKYVEK